MFQPIIQSPGIQNSDRNIRLIIRQNKSELVCFSQRISSNKSFISQDTPTVSIPKSESKQNPWKVGMRLEAKDRKNPNILAIANISKSFFLFVFNKMIFIYEIYFS